MVLRIERAVPVVAAKRFTVPLVLLAAAVVTAAQPSDYFVLLYNFALITALLVLSLSLIFGYAGLLSLAHAAYFGIGAYVSALLTKELDLPVVLGMVGATFVAAVLGYLLAPMGKLMADYYAMGTLAFGLIMYTLFGNLSLLTGGWSGLSGVPALSLFGFDIVTPKQEMILLSVVLAGSFLLVQQVTAGYTGRSYRAVRDDQVSARAIGLPVEKIKNHAVTIGCGLAGLAGSLMAHMSQFVGPESFSYFRSILLVLMVVVAGRDNLGGAVIVGALLHLVDEAFGEWPLVRPILYGGLIVVCMIYFPGGIAPWIEQRFRRRRSHGAPKAATPDREVAGPEEVGQDVPAGNRWSRNAVAGVGLGEAVPWQLLDQVPAGSGPVLECRGLGKAFGGLKALQNLSFSVMPGEIHGLIGPNGAGKSTALNLISGLDRPTEGEVRYMGQRLIGDMDVRARQGLVRTFQRGRLFMSMTVFENIQAAVGPHSAGRLWMGLLRPQWSAEREREAAAVTAAIIRLLGLEDVQHTPVKNLPFGLRRLVELGRALATRPRVLLLDEPAAGLNPTERAKLMEVLQEVRARWGLSVVLVEHDIQLVAKLCDRITVMNFGQKIAEGPPAQVFEDEAVKRAYLGNRKACQTHA